MLGNASLNGFHDVDPEKDAAHTSATTSHGGNNELDDGLPGASRFDSMTKRLAVWGVESRGLVLDPNSYI